MRFSAAVYCSHYISYAITLRYTLCHDAIYTVPFTGICIVYVYLVLVCTNFVSCISIGARRLSN